MEFFAEHSETLEGIAAAIITAVGAVWSVYAAQNKARGLKEKIVYGIIDVGLDAADKWAEQKKFDGEGGQIRRKLRLGERKDAMSRAVNRTRTEAKALGKEHLLPSSDKDLADKIHQRLMAKRNGQA